MGWLMEAAPIAATTAISEARQSSIFLGGHAEPRDDCLRLTNHDDAS